MILTKIILASTLAFVFIQDYKERQVYWFLFPIMAFLCGFLFYRNTLPELFINALIMNIGFIMGLITIIFLYSKLKLRTKLLNTIGLGDLFFFLAISLSFSTISFIIIFIGALVFSLVLHLLLVNYIGASSQSIHKSKPLKIPNPTLEHLNLDYQVKKYEKVITVPLAGYMSLFFLMSYLFYWIGYISHIYTF